MRAMQLDVRHGWSVMQRFAEHNPEGQCTVRARRQLHGGCVLRGPVYRTIRQHQLHNGRGGAGKVRIERKQAISCMPLRR
jgi:hypothetical protein